MLYLNFIIMCTYSLYYMYHFGKGITMYFKNVKNEKKNWLTVILSDFNATFKYILALNNLASFVNRVC